jgi:hypothetical protein
MAERVGPFDQLLVARPVGGEATRLDPASELVQGDRDVEVFVGVDTYHDSTSPR